MNSTVIAMQNVDRAEASAEAEAARKRLLHEAKTAREALPSSQNEVFSVQFAKGIADRKAQVERLFDEQEVKLGEIDRQMDEKITAESAVLSQLAKQVEESRARLSRLESEKLRTREEAKRRFREEIAAARKLIEAFEAGAAVLAKPVE